MVVWSLDNNVERGAENVEDIIEDKEETGSILQDETAKENLVKLVEEKKHIEEPDDAKQENIETNSNVEESDKETSNLCSGQWFLLWFLGSSAYYDNKEDLEQSLEEAQTKDEKPTILRII